MVANTSEGGSNSKKVLFIAYHFPPDAAVGAIRTAKFVKYLSQLGWEPVVLTIRQEHILLSDFERIKDVEHVPTVRTRVWPTMTRLALSLRDTCKKIGHTGGRRSPPSSAVSLKNGEGRNSSALKKPSSYTKYLASLFEIPDKHIGWLIPAVWKAYWLVKRHDIRLVVTSSPPRTTALVGLALSYLAEFSLFTDLRDPWFRPANKFVGPQTWVSNRILGWLEKKIIERSRRVITTTENYHSYLRSFYLDLPEGKVVTICNGYDEEDFREPEPIQPGPNFTLSYLGTFYLGRSPKFLLQAVGALVKTRVLDKSRLEIRFIGDVRYADGESVEELVRFHDLSGCVKIMAAIPYKDALMAMIQSNVLLLFAPDQFYCIPTKAFEYLASRRDILCFSKDGATADLIKKTGSGTVVKPDDIEEIKAAIVRFHTKYRQGRCHNENINISQFERKTLT
ncbi:MAG: glycosyltransferase, partial [Nitrososphaera sp.]|nr:glycosyltransferase [Nitrososphaera sp.]